MENFVDDPLDDRLRKARETMDRMTATIQSIEEIVANPALKTPASLELFKHSQYQKKRFLTGFNFADFSPNDQRSILHIGLS